jgi:hypothetical protein
MAILNNSNAISSGGYDINNSLRIRQSASANLTRTPASAGNRKTFTFSAWIKRGKLGDDAIIYSGTVNPSNQVGAIFFNGGSDALRIFDYQASALWNLTTTPVFRDPSAWYHIVVAFDTTQATASNRVKIYVNGNQVTAFSSATYPNQNTDTFFNYNATQALGRYAWTSAGGDFDGYLADVNFIDGSAKTPSDFGETDTTTGSWKPKAYTGTYGTNGFELSFSDIATTSGSNAGLGKDFSGNANYFTTNNISVTAGTTYDAMTDSPTNTSATTANYPVMTPAYLPRGSYTLSEANLKCSGAYASSNYPRIMSSMGMTSGKYYWEYVGATFPATESCSIGIKEVNSSYPSATGGLGAVSGEIGLFNTGRLDNNGSTTGSFSTSFTTGDVIGIAFDATNGTLNYYKNGSALGSQITGIAAGTYAPAFDCLSTSQTVWNVNYGQRPFAYTPPTGFNRLNTFNLPNSTIVKGNTVMDATLYTGTGANQTVVNAGGFKPDLVWTKGRSYADSHALTNSVAGAARWLASNTTGAEANYTGNDSGVKSFVSNGFTLQADGSEIFNKLNATYVAWQWQAGQGTNTSNTSGSITSTVSVNATAGFSIVTYTGTGANATVGHGLGVAPKMIICKNRTDVISWLIYHSSLGATKYLEFNTSAAVTATPAWNNTEPTSSLFTVGTYTNNNGSGKAIVAYCWAEIAGFSKFSSYTGNGSTDGPFVFTGFRPKFVMIKRTDSTGDWNMYDSSIGAYNVIDDLLKANTSAAETTYYTYYIDFLSNGFKLRETDTGQNASGGTYIYMAFAENPFKNANAR